MRTTSTPPISHRTDPRAPERSGPHRLSTIQASLLVARREILAQARSKSFVISTAILLIIALAGIIISGVLANRASETIPVAVIDRTASVIAGNPSVEAVRVSDEASARQAVEDGSVDAAILPADTTTDPLGFSILAKDSEPNNLVASLSVAPRVSLLEPQATSPMTRYFISLVFGMIFMMAGMIFGQTIAQNTVVEKQTRTVELLLCAVPAQALLAGKVIGYSILAFCQIAALAAVSVIGLTVTQQNDLLTMLGAPIVWFAVFFAVGFIMLAAVFAASASLVSRTEDTGSVLMPVTLVTMLPYVLVVTFNDNPTALTAISYIPFTAPVAMPFRLFLGTAQWWEPLVSLAILSATTVLTIVIGARIYQYSLLKTGPRVHLREALAARED